MDHLLIQQSADKKGKARVKIRPSAYGWFLLFLLAWIPLAAMVTVNNFLFIIFTMMVGMTWISHKLAKRNLASVAITRRFPDEIYAETPFTVDYVLRTGETRLGSFSLTFQEDLPLSTNNGPVKVSHVTAQDTTRSSATFSISSRGDRSVPAGRIFSAFPFGLATYSRECGPRDSVLVFPRLVPVEDDIPQWLGGLGKGAERPDPFGTIPYLFRDYVPGDRYKHIDWKKTASSGSLVTRILSDEGSREVTIRLGRGASERAISRAASLVVFFTGSGRPVSLEGPGFRTQPGHGREVRLKLLTILARWDDSSLQGSLDRGDRGLSVEIDTSGGLAWAVTEKSHADGI